MSSRCRDRARGVLAAAIVALAGCGGTAPVQPPSAEVEPQEPAQVEAPVLRVCADPNNLPFSNERREGFENRLAEIVARDMGATVRYTWHAQRRGFIRNTLKAGHCDVVMGVPSRLEMAATTRPYYRSRYAFVSRTDGPLVRSFDDPALRRLRIGVHLIGDDGANAPPAHALARRGVVQNVAGYPVYGDYREPNPPARLIEAVARGEIDVAVAWGPLAGYFAARQAVPLRVTPTAEQSDGPILPMAFDISMGVRRGDEARRAQLDDIIERRRGEIDALLAEYRVPRGDADAASVRVAPGETR